MNRADSVLTRTMETGEERGREGHKRRQTKVNTGECRGMERQVDKHRTKLASGERRRRRHDKRETDDVVDGECERRSVRESNGLKVVQDLNGATCIEERGK